MTRHPMSHRDRGRLLAQILTGAWRTRPCITPPDLQRLDLIQDALLQSGEAGLVWRVVSQAGDCSRGRRLREAFRQQTAHALQQEQYIERLFNLFEIGFQITPILVKGWSCARLYPEPGLRPYGDIDICVPPDRIDLAKEILERYPPIGSVDLHAGVPDMPDRTWAQLAQRAVTTTLRSARVRVLGPEDHLRFVALHLLRHGGKRPLWLCDVAVALEARLSEFDWDYCLSGSAFLASWVVAMVGAAQRLLGAKVGDREIEARLARLPGWLFEAILWRWGAGVARQPFAYYRRHPLEGFLFELLNPLYATFRLGVMPCPAWQIPVLQLAAILGRVGKVPRWLAKKSGRLASAPVSSSFSLHQSNL
jgi:hypothetical protein